MGDPAQHARLSPSAGSRWLPCSASVLRIEEANLPEESSSAAQWGTDSHEYLEKGLQLTLSPLFLHNGDPDEAAKAECAAVAFEYVQIRQHKMKPCAVRAEAQVNPGAMVGVKICQGTSDIILASTELEVVDLKGGRGVVEPTSPQLGLYLLGALNDYWPDRSVPRPFKRFISTIVQPRAPHAAGAVRSKEWTLEELLGLEQAMMATAAAVESGQVTAVPGEEQCRWCPVRGQCPEYAQWVFSAAMDASGIDSKGALAALDLATVTSAKGKLGAQQLSALMDLRSSLLSWIDAFSDEVLSRLSRREGIPGYKLIRGTGRPAWKGEKDLVPKFLRKLKLKKAQIFTDTLKTPLQVMKGPNLTEDQSAAVAELWHRPEGALKVVPSNHPGEDAMQAGADFQPVEQQTSKE